MKYLESFTFASEADELDFFFSLSKLDMSCYDMNNAYPFHIFPKKKLKRLDFEPITVLYGTNGSGKSTALNVIAEKLGISRSAPFNNAPCMKDYTNLCRYETADRRVGIPKSSEIITSDGVFDLLLDVRAINEGIDRKREELLNEYDSIKADCRDNGWQMSSLSEYEELKRRNEVRLRSKSSYTSGRLNIRESRIKSNGESAYLYFTEKIRDNSLYLLDEPENSLSPGLQAELAGFLFEAVRFFNCQLIISTHSPFLLSIPGAAVYDLDSVPVRVRKWTELPNVRSYYELFKSHMSEFE